jgi:hypothetical protein
MRPSFVYSPCVYNSPFVYSDAFVRRSDNLLRAAELSSEFPDERPVTLPHFPDVGTPGLGAQGHTVTKSLKAAYHILVSNGVTNALSTRVSTGFKPAPPHPALKLGVHLRRHVRLNRDVVPQVDVDSKT